MTKTIVIGAGAAGAPLAARLSEDRDREVLVIEAGSVSADVPPELLDASTVQAAAPGHPANWAYPADLAPGVPYLVARGRVLGGSSTINGGGFVRPRPEDCAAWAAAAGPAWSYEALLPVMRALERDLDFGAGPVHGDAGPIPVRRPADGIVTPDAGLMNPNHFLAVAIDYLCAHRPGWRPDAAIGKTLVSSMLIDRVAAALGRRLLEVPVGFKWFVPGLLDGSVAFGGEESAGASFVRFDGTVWSTDKDGLLLCLLAAEILAVTGKTPSQRYAELEAEFGASAYERVDAPATAEQKATLALLSPASVTATELAGEAITAKLIAAPGNGAAIGGLKVTTQHAWFAARPSGTEDVYKLYAESLLGPEHLRAVQREAQAVITAALGGR